LLTCKHTIKITLMKTENATLLGRLLDRVRPADLLDSEHRLALRSRVEQVIEETGLNRYQFGARIRSELCELRTWLSDTRELTIETLTEICTMLHISLGDLVAEQA
jgi:hypothetical protein